MANKRLPEIVVAGGRRHKLTVFLIHTKHPDGTPALCKLIKDDATVDLAGGEEFMTAYIPEEMIKGK